MLQPHTLVGVMTDQGTVCGSPSVQGALVSFDKGAVLP